MLVDLKQILSIAEAGGCAIPAFNVYNLETVIGVVHAAEAMRAPVIMQVYPRLMKEETGYYLAPVILAAARQATVPVCFHLDHGPSELETTRALRYGATGIMLDGSSLDIDENIAVTKRAVDICRYVNVQVEGELGHVGTTNDKTMDEFTAPADAKRFVDETGVACLAVLVGTAHGRYKKPPKLDIERICQIREATGNLPLVLHGGSGVPDDQIREAVRCGIRKINFATDLCFAFLDGVSDELANTGHSHAIDAFMKAPIAAVQRFCEEKIDLFGTEKKV